MPVGMPHHLPLLASQNCGATNIAPSPIDLLVSISAIDWASSLQHYQTLIGMHSTVPSDHYQMGVRGPSLDGCLGISQPREDLPKTSIATHPCVHSVTHMMKPTYTSSLVEGASRETPLFLTTSNACVTPIVLTIHSKLHSSPVSRCSWIVASLHALFNPKLDGSPHSQDYSPKTGYIHIRYLTEHTSSPN